MNLLQPTEAEMAKLAEMVQLLQRVDRPLYTPEFMRKNMIQCTCGKIRVIGPDSFFPTGFVWRNGTRLQAVEHLCPDCAKEYAGTAKLVCIRCSPARVIARIAPGRDAKSGLEFRVDRCYHASGCPVCQHNGEPSIMIEQAVMLARQVK
jgi:hypothetical protein